MLLGLKITCSEDKQSRDANLEKMAKNKAGKEVEK